MSFTRFAFATLPLLALLAGCAGNAGTEPGEPSEPTASTHEALNFRAQCHQRCDAARDAAEESCSFDGFCVCQAEDERGSCYATCDGRGYTHIPCE